MTIYEKLGIPPKPTDPEKLRIWKIKYHAILYRSQTFQEDMKQGESK